MYWLICIVAYGIEVCILASCILACSGPHILASCIPACSEPRIVASCIPASCIPACSEPRIVASCIPAWSCIPACSEPRIVASCIPACSGPHIPACMFVTLLLCMLASAPFHKYQVLQDESLLQFLYAHPLTYFHYSHPHPSCQFHRSQCN